MTDSPGSVSQTEGVESVETVGRRIIDACLGKDGSILTPGREIWTTTNLQELVDSYVNQPDAGSGGFFEKLANQLATVSPDAIQLFAELLLLNLLPVLNFTGDTKIDHLKRVLALGATDVTIPPNIKDTLRLGGVFRGGQAFTNHRWAQLVFLVRFALHFKSLPAQQQSESLADPLAFRETVRAVPTGQATQQNSLQYLAFPEFFLPIVSASDRRAIRDTFIDRLDESTGDVDQDLHRLSVLMSENTGAPVHFYSPPWVDQWRGSRDPVTPTDAVQHAWRVRGSDVLGLDMVPVWRTKGIVSLSARLLRPVEPDVTRDDLKSCVEEDYRTSGYSARQEKFEEFYAFMQRIHPGDLVVTFSRQRLHFGTVTGDAEHTPTEDGRSNLRRTVKWEARTIPLDSVPDELTPLLNNPRDVTDLSAHIETLRTLAGQHPPTPATKAANLPDATPELADHLHVPQAWLQECIDLLRDRPQLIFYGPPGTGKTYLAQKIARHIAPDGNVTVVQFHPAYSYEDFFEGYRPVPLGNGQIGFDLKPGPLRRIVEKAAENPTAVYVLIIDEINRGNLAKIFGELYFLLEYRNAAIDLMYRSEKDAPFSLPKNLVLLGTMNTADRSIALVDAAIRRRFAFVPLHPEESPVNEVLRGWLAAEGRDGEVADLLDALNRRIEDPDFKIGPSYFMRDAVFAPGGIERVWRTAILPLLEEHHYGDRIVDVAETYGLDAIRSTLDEVTSAEHAELDDDATADAD
ncbi:McrB family protein [Nocardia sp. Marseille-Q1738]